MELTDWIVQYVKARNAISQTLKEHSVKGDEVTCVHKHKVHHFLCSPKLVVPTVRDHYTVVCLHTKKNLTFLLEHWGEFLQPHLSVLFVNPSAGAQWQVTPKVHAMVADEKYLEQGLRSLASDVPVVAE